MASGPHPFPCGGKNQPACPPVETLVALPDGSHVKVKVHKVNGRHFFEEILEEIGNAIGEAKFGG